jgi:hypothetical protein
MTSERLRILNLVAAGKISAAEAATLLEALGGSGGDAPAGAPPPSAPRYLRVVVEDREGDQSGRVNVRVPMSLLRAGVRLAALLPSGVHDHINKALRENGLDIDVSKIKPENLEEIVEHLAELTVDVEGNRGEKVRVFCE